MKATITKKSHTGNIAKNRKENKFSKQLNVVTKELKEVVIARFYWTDSRCYCCVWVHGPECCTSGGGYAGGYGYHMESAALSSALSDAGVKLSEDISARGDSAMLDALEAVARKASGKRVVKTFSAHA